MPRICTAADKINALRIIKSECEIHEECFECSFSGADGRCLINTQEPSDWNIVSEKGIVKFLY